MTIGKMGEEAFRTFATAKDYKDIIQAFNDLCRTINVDRTDFRRLYRNIKDRVQTKEIKVLYALLDKRAKQAVYEKNKACSGAKIVIVGAGPCGLRMAIEGALLGGRVIVVEMRDYFARNNVLHLWPFVIQDLKQIGAKYFYPGFCTGSLNHISIRRLQSILLKIALMLGVEVHAPVTVRGLQEPEEDEQGNAKGWRVELSPEVPGLTNLDVDIIVGADGKRNTIPGFERKVFRGKPAIAITCNFVNFRTRADAQVQEIGGIFYIFKQEFFDDLKARSGIDLENFVYYKNDTHYFVMTAKKRCLLQKGVLYEDCSETAQLLRRENVNMEKLTSFALEAATIATDNKIPMMQFASNHREENDVAIFDFTAMTQATHASLVTERLNKRLLKCIVGDSLIEPFWPTGSGCARGWLSVFDAAWIMKSWCPGKRAPLDVLSEREALLKTLSQASPQNLKPKLDHYTIDPTTRYGYVPTPLKAEQVRHLWDNDDLIDNPPPAPMRRFTEAEILLRRRGRASSIDGGIMLSWYQERLSPYHDVVTVNDLVTSWKNGRAFCALVHSFRPELIDLSEVKTWDAVTNLRRAFELIETEWSLSPLLSAEDLVMSDSPDSLALLTYLTQLKDTLEKEHTHSCVSGLKPREKMSSLEVPRKVSRGRRPSAISLLTGMSEMIDTHRPYYGGVTSHVDVIPSSETDIRHACTGIAAERIKALQTKPCLPGKTPSESESSSGRVRTISGNWMIQTTSSDSESESDDEQNKSATLAEQLSTSGRLQQLTTMFNNMANNDDSSPLPPSPPRKPITPVRRTRTGEVCCVCGLPMFIMERHSHNGYFFHRHCSRCHVCQRALRVGSLYIHNDDDNVKFFCQRHAQTTGHFTSRWNATSLPTVTEIQNESAEVPRRRRRHSNKENEEASSRMALNVPTDTTMRSRSPTSPTRRRVMFDDEAVSEKTREEDEELPPINEPTTDIDEDPARVYTDTDIDLGLASTEESESSSDMTEESEGSGEECSDDEEVEDEGDEEEEGSSFSNGSAPPHIECSQIDQPSPGVYRTEARLVIKMNGDSGVNSVPQLIVTDMEGKTDQPVTGPDQQEEGEEKPKLAVRRRSKAGLHGARSRPPTIYRQSTSLRLLLAHEIQTGLEVLDQQEEVLEQRGRQVEEGLRSADQEVGDVGSDHQELLDEWLEVLQQKQELRNKELKLLLKKKLLDLQERKRKIQRALMHAPTSLDLLDEMVDVTRDIKEVEEEISNMNTNADKSRAVLEDGEQLDMPASYI